MMDPEDCGPWEWQAVTNYLIFERLSIECAIITSVAIYSCRLTIEALIFMHIRQCVIEKKVLRVSMR